MQVEMINGVKFLVLSDFKEYYIDFKVLTSYSDEDVYLSGFVKWDGCSNFNFGENNIMFHFCCEEDFNTLNLVLKHLYSIAKNHFNFE